MESHQSPVLPNDVLVDGFVAHTFSPQDAHAFFTLLLRTPDFLQQYGVSYLQDRWNITHIPQNVPHVQPSLLGTPTHNPPPLPRLLDFNVRITEGTVVPQRRWVPADETDVGRYVAEATLQLPVFFLNVNGGVGFWLPDILQRRDRDLLNRDSEAPLGGVTTTHIRINWPGYENLNGDRQIAIRDETHARNPITLGRFMKHVGTSIDKFFNQCMANGHGTDPRWVIAPDLITQRHVKVIGAVHVSAGRWMPIIQHTGYVI